MRRLVAVLVAGVTVCLLAGCFPVGDPVPEPVFPAGPVQREPLKPITEEAVLAFCPAMAAEHFGGFTSYESVYACRADDRRPSDGTTTYGPWQAVYRVTDPRPLLELYATPDETRIVTGRCPRSVPDPLILWVHSGGTVQAVYAPVDGCGVPQEEVATAYQTARRELLVEVETGGPVSARDTPAEH
jgi:hypothetical protein